MKHPLQRVGQSDVAAQLSSGAWSSPPGAGSPYVFAKFGLVHGIRTWSKARVSAVGDIDSICAHPGVVGEISLRSTVRSTETFFVRHHDGTDTPVTLEDAPGTVADGHEVVLLFGSLKHPDRGHLYALHNGRTGDSLFLHPGMEAIAPAYEAWVAGCCAAILLAILLVVPGVSWLLAMGVVVVLSIPLRVAAYVGHYWPLTRALKKRANGLLASLLPV